MDMNKLKDWLGLVLIIVIIVGILLVISNQAISYFEKAKLLLNPCQLCLKENPNLTLQLKPIFNFTIN